ncbi:MAG TPA: NAD(P)-dependent oxidoreductase [Stellaceae bacterium]|nr:NAD(P)-dependent oxidoreductase [Stellaceae bacterium]
MNVLVTGGAGFLGSNLVAGLHKAGHKPVAFDVAPPGPEALIAAPILASAYRRGQIGDIARLFDICRNEKIDTIIHTAGIVGLETSLAEPVATYQVNVMGLINVCEVARQLGMRRVVFVSSNAAYHKGSGPALGEADAVFSIRDGNPAAHYGTSKMAAEAIGMAYASFQEVDFLAARITAIYGLGMRSPMYIKPMVEGAALGRRVRFETGGPMKRDYTYIADACAGILAMATAPSWPKGEQRVLNIAAGKAHTAAEVAEVVRRVVPDASIEIGAGLTPLEAENVKMRTALDVAAAKRLLNWAPVWSLEDGIRDYVEHFRGFAQAGH